MTISAISSLPMSVHPVSTLVGSNVQNLEIPGYIPLNSGELGMPSGQNAMATLISSIGGGASLSSGSGIGLGGLSSPNQSNSLADGVNSLVNAISGGNASLNGISASAGPTNTLAIGVESMLSAVTTMPEIPEFVERAYESQEVNRVTPSNGYNPNATTEELMAETYALLEETVNLVGGYVDTTA